MDPMTMPNPDGTPTPIFVSYSHSDKEWLRRLQIHLRPLVRDGDIDLWDDTRIQPGADWKSEIDRALAAAKVAVLLVSPDFLASDFIHEQELPVLLAAAKERCGTLILPVIISHSLYANSPLGRFQAFNAPDRPLKQLTKARQDKVLSDLARAIAEGLSKETNAADVNIDISRLQRAATRELIDRGSFSETLSSALANPNVGLVGIVADGGIGKTAVVFDWLSRIGTMERGLDHLFAWTCFDMERRRPTTSAQFFIDAFKHFRQIPDQWKINLPHGEADFLIEILRKNKSILVLDGLQSFQDASYERRGEFTDEEIGWFLQQVATYPRGQEGRLVIVTSRLDLVDLRNAPGYLPVSMEQLEDQDGAELLSRLGVVGTPQELAKGSGAYEGHSLSLVLLGSIIANWFPNRHINNRSLIPSLVAAPYDKQPTKRYYEQARNVMDFYETEVSQEEDIILLEMMGLFLVPMDANQRDHIVANARFAEPLRSLTPLQWTNMERRLEEYRLLIPQAERSLRRSTWDCHQLIREHFRRKLSKDQELWRNAHSVLFDYFQNRATFQPDSREGLRPLYRAVRHGCLAHRFRDSLHLYQKRILRDEAQGYSTNRLGAAADDIACLHGFLASNSHVKDGVVEELTEAEVAWLWARMAFCETCRGAIDDAVRNRENQLRFSQNKADLMGQASAWENLSALRLFGGRLVDAEDAARRAIDCATEADDWGQVMRGTCRLATAHYFRGDLEACKKEFEDAASQKEKCGGPDPWIIMDHGFYYRLWGLDCASTQQQYKEILRDAEGASGPDQSWLSPLGLDKLVKAISLLRIGDDAPSKILFQEALQILTESGFVLHLPYYYRAKVEFDLHKGDRDSALKNAEEAKRLAVYYGTPLLLADSFLSEAEVHVATGRPDLARRAQREATQRIIDHGYHLRTIELKIVDWRISLLEGAKHQANTLRKQVLEQIEETGRKGLLARYGPELLG